MKTRMLSLILACVMVISLVPALLLVAGAEGTETVFTSSFWEEAQAGKITYDTEAQTVSYAGNWQTVILAANSYDPIVLERLSPRFEGEKPEGLWAITPVAHDGITKNGWSQWWWGSLPGSGLMNLETYTIGFSNPQGISAYMYTVTESGEFDLNVEIDHYVAPADENREFFMSIMVNEKMVWPQYAGTYHYATSTDRTDGNLAWTVFQGDANWYHVTRDTTQETLNEALSSLQARVKEGDRVEVCYRLAPYTTYTPAEATAMPKITGNVASGARSQYLLVRENGVVQATTKIENGSFVLPEYTGTEQFRGWDITGDGVVDAKPGATIDATQFDTDLIYADAVTVGISRWTDNVPTLDEDNMPVFHGNWKIGAYDVIASTFTPFISPADTYGIISTTGSVWSGAGGGMYTATGKIALSGCTAEGGFMNEINYTAEYSGNILFDLEKLTLHREGAEAADYISYNFAVYVNGEQVWPADGELFNIQSPDMYSEPTIGYDGLADIKAGGFPLSLEVTSGDVISLRTQMGNANNWMVFAHPIVIYETLGETPIAVSADIAIGTNLDLNFYVEVIAPREDAEVGLEYRTNNPSPLQLLKGGTALDGVYNETNGFYQFTYEMLSAKDMSKMIYVRPYSYVGEDYIYGDVVPFSIQMYVEKTLGRSAKLDKVLATLVTYGAGAQSAFGHNMNNLANAILPEHLRPGFFNGTLNDVYAQGEGENPITAVSLLLDNEFGFKFLIDNVEGAEKYVLEFADNASFTDSIKVDMEATAEGKEQKAIVRLALADLDKTYYARVIVDDEAGATLTYSMESYVARISNTDCTEGMYQLIIALAQFSRAVEDYLA